MIQQFIFSLKLARFGFLHVECTDYAHTGKIFSCNSQNFVQPGLNLPVKWSRQKHNAKYHNCQCRNGDHKYHRRFYINGKRHDHGSKDNKRGTQEKAEYKVYSILHLIDITGHPGDQCRVSQRVQFCKRQALNMLK